VLAAAAHGKFRTVVGCWLASMGIRLHVMCGSPLQDGKSCPAYVSMGCYILMGVGMFIFIFGYLDYIYTQKAKKMQQSKHTIAKKVFDFARSHTRCLRCLAHPYQKLMAQVCNMWRRVRRNGSDDSDDAFKYAKMDIAPTRQSTGMDLRNDQDDYCYATSLKKSIADDEEVTRIVNILGKTSRAGNPEIQEYLEEFFERAQCCCRSRPLAADFSVIFGFMKADRGGCQGPLMSDDEVEDAINLARKGFLFRAILQWADRVEDLFVKGLRDFETEF